MFKLKLRQLNGSQKGKRYPVDASPFVIGRHEDCNLVFSSRTVSRRHCAILIHDSTVVIRDLKSSNGVFVDDIRISTDGATMLSHHSIIRIGKYFFRVSVRDAKTNEPYRPGVAKLSSVSGASIASGGGSSGLAEQLLGELDELATQFESTATERPSSVLDPRIMDTIPIEQEHDSSLVERDEEKVDVTDVAAGSAEPQPTASEEISQKVESKEKEDAGQSERDKKKEPDKLPEHLRPKRAKDSQDAATKALRDLFTR